MRFLQRGVAIAETLVAIFLLALLILVVFNLFPTTVMANRQGSERLQALSVAQTALSEARNRPFESLVVGSASSYPDTKADGLVFHTLVKVLPPERGDGTRLKILEVAVSWTSRQGHRSLVERLWVHRRIEERT